MSPFLIISFTTLPCIHALPLPPCSSSFIYSLVELITIIGTQPMHDPELFFETGAMLFTFVSFGRFLEHIAKGKTSEALKDLMSQNVDAATLIVTDEDGEHQKVIAIELVQRGDIIKVRMAWRAEGLVGHHGWMVWMPRRLRGCICGAPNCISTAVCNRCWRARSCLPMA